MPLRHNPRLLERAREFRQPQTPAENKVWQAIRRHTLGAQIRRQHPIGHFIVDFYCAQAKLCIEIDGDSHAEQLEYDAARTAWLEERGYAVIRFTNREVHENLAGVLEVLRVEIEKRRKE